MKFILACSLTVKVMCFCIILPTYEKHLNVLLLKRSIVLCLKREKCVLPIIKDVYRSYLFYLYLKD